MSESRSNSVPGQRDPNYWNQVQKDIAAQEAKMDFPMRKLYSWKPLTELLKSIPGLLRGRK